MTDTNQIKAENVRLSGMTEGLSKDEAVVVDGQGNVISRADRKTLERDYPGFTIFGSKDLGGRAAAAKTETVEGATAVPPAVSVPSTPTGHPISDALADDPTPEPLTRTHPLDDGTPFEGPPAVGGPELAQNAAAAIKADPKGTPIKDALGAAHAANVKAENSGRHAKPDELGAAEAKVLDPDGKEPLDEKPAVDPDRPAKKAADPLDHDDDGRRGGNALNKDKVAADKSSRQRKPNNDE